MPRSNLATYRTEIKNLLKNQNLANSRIDYWLYLAEQRVVREIDLDQLLIPYNISTVVSTRDYYIPTLYRRIRHINDVTNNNASIEEVSIRELTSYDPDGNQTGNISKYAVMGIHEVSAQPLAASVISIVSSSASDTSQTVKLAGYNANQVYIEETLTLNGTIAVTGTTSFTELIEVRKSADTVGIITVSDDDPVVLTRIPFNEHRMQYMKLRVFPIPDSIDTIHIYSYRKPLIMEDAQDTPDIPEEWVELLLKIALEFGAYDNQDFDLYFKLRDENELGLMKLKTQQGNRRTYRRRKVGSLKELIDELPLDKTRIATDS